MKKASFGDKIRQRRKELGLSQTDLAQQTGLSARSIQRLEKGENQPRGHTLNQLSTVLGIAVDQLIHQELLENKGYNALLLLSPLLFLIHPVFAVISPLVLWLFKRNLIQQVDEIGRRTINTQITWLILYFGGMLVIMTLSFSKIQQAGHISIVELSEIWWFFQVKAILFAINIILILLSTIRFWFYDQLPYQTGIPIVSSKSQITLIMITGTFILLFGFFSLLPRIFSFGTSMPKEEVLEFVDKIVFNPYHEDGSHRDTLRQYLIPGMDSIYVHRILYQTAIPLSKTLADHLEMKNYAFSINTKEEIYFMHFIHSRGSRLHRFILEITRLNGQYYVKNYFGEELEESIFKQVDLDKNESGYHWRVKTKKGWADFNFSGISFNFEYKGLRGIRKWKKMMENSGEEW